MSKVRVTVSCEVEVEDGDVERAEILAEHFEWSVKASARGLLTKIENVQSDVDWPE